MAKNPITSPLSDADRDAVGTVLQATLVDLVDLSLIGKQAHWNVIGKNFRSVHLQLDELVVLARNAADQVAERAAALGVTPNGTAKIVAASSGVPEIESGWLKEDQVVASITSSLASLISRLYDPSGGRVTIDGVDLRDLRLTDLAGIVGVVSQETYLLHTTVRENLRYARPDATDAEIEAAARAACSICASVASGRAYRRFSRTVVCSR
jgi:starvation-inducible DNA-binding protein